MTENQRALVRYRVEQAADALRAAESLLRQGLLRDSLNRSYYAMFYAVLALLATRALGTSKHSGAISLFDREFVKQGLFPKDLSAWVHRAFEKRLDADYTALVGVEEQDTEEMVSLARQFVQAVGVHLAPWLLPSPPKPSSGAELKPN